MVDVRAGAGVGDADVARDLRHRRRGAVEQIDARLARRRPARATRPPAPLCASAMSAAASSSSASTALAAALRPPAVSAGGSSVQENCSSRLKGAATMEPIVDRTRSGRARRNPCRNCRSPRSHDVVVRVVRDRVDRAGRLAGVAADADRGIDQVLLDRRAAPARSVVPPSMAVPPYSCQIFTYSKSPGLLSMPTLGGAIQEAKFAGRRLPAASGSR